MVITTCLNTLSYRFFSTLQTQKHVSPHTVSNYQRDLAQWQTFVTSTVLSDSTEKKEPDHVSTVISPEFSDWLQDYDYDQARLFLYFLNDQSYAQRSIARKIACLRSFWTFLSAEGVTRQNPWKLIKLTSPSQQLPEVLSSDQMQGFLDHLPAQTDLDKRNLAIFELLYATGMRVSELTSLTKGALDLTQQKCTVIGKGNRERICFFGQTCQRALQTYLNCRLSRSDTSPQSPLFLNHKKTALTPRSIQRILQIECKRQGLPYRMTPHLFRHSFATALLSQGADIRVIQELLGHRSLNSTQLYTHLSKESLFKTYQHAHPRATLDNTAI